jgi:predicted small integral membrane protein
MAASNPAVWHRGSAMFTANPFAELSVSISPAVMQAYVVLMIAFVAAGTIFDMVHKRSAEYFFAKRRAAAARSKRAVGAGEKSALALRMLAVDVVAAGEFCSLRRRLAHLLTMYGFLAYTVTTLIMVFRYPRPDLATPPLLPQLWHIGALMVFAGCAWFWFFIRVDVSAEGHSPFRIVRADIFVLSLMTSAALALFWSGAQQAGSDWAAVALGLYLIATTVLFGTAGWSKFPHMFYKPAAALQRRIEEAGGELANLPPSADRPESFGSARRRPQHY